ncbi:antitoxin [Aldersonia sp. NBC_00410]|uniref:FitA-like ribbon-helix-helix domain-containing protein n=1 Tax=Aldersonia sp. NBC_00410 TaxID=2975954 RepID=UPI00224CE63D|nr:antitoxin [Aldersonia sp. NBC_00410]MCX5042182.1 antitoxin [Aldersonia sp. NBC_00410]
MATIQVREIPEDAYEVIRERARAAGRSIQSYMRDLIVEFAATPTTDEVLAEIASAREKHGPSRVTRESILEALDADRR